MDQRVHRYIASKKTSNGRSCSPFLVWLFSFFKKIGESYSKKQKFITVCYFIRQKLIKPPHIIKSEKPFFILYIHFSLFSLFLSFTYFVHSPSSLTSSPNNTLSHLSSQHHILFFLFFLTSHLSPLSSLLPFSHFLSHHSSQLSSHSLIIPSCVVEEREFVCSCGKPTRPASNHRPHAPTAQGVGGVGVGTARCPCAPTARGVGGDNLVTKVSQD